MKFSSSYEPSQFEPDIYAAWEAAGVFQPTIPTVPVDQDSDGVDDRLEADEHQASSRESGAWQGEDERRSPVATGRADAAREDAWSRLGDTYSIVMPPPNANGNLHIGHGLTIALEDSLTRFYRLNHKSTWYIPGADHAGFETWVVYEKALEAQGHTRFEYDRDELYARVWDFVAMQRGNMELQLRALGASCAWPDLTFTLDENVIDRVYTTFEKMWNDGLIYRGEKLVNFCPKHQTAFADIEVEHKDEDGTLWEIEYRLTNTGTEVSKNELGNSAARGLSEAAMLVDLQEGVNEVSKNVHSRHFATNEEQVSEVPPVTTGRNERAENESFLTPLEAIVVSTTRPETLFGDMAVAVNPDDPRYKHLIGAYVELPLTGRTIPIIADEHADMEYGTGAVKITPAHDFDDFEVGERHALPRLQVISESGKMINVPEKYLGLTAAECRKEVLKDLKSAGLLKGEKKIVHSVAHCYKCGTVLEPTLKEQWFVDVKTLARTAIAHLERDEIKFYPASKKQVLINYLENLKDWNISRQIPWGIAIPMFRRADLSEVSENAASQVTTENEGASPIATGAPDWIFDRRTHLKTIERSGVTYVRDEDTFDTWFSSSHWPIVCTDWSETHPTPYYPLNVMETAGDILFAWVARMIMMGLYVTGEVPFKDVYLHGLVLDAHGKKMSKSKGNVINPMDMITKYGSDAFRLGILRGRSAGMNQAFSENSVISGRNLCNKLWNISRLIQSIVDEDTAEMPVTTSQSGKITSQSRYTVLKQSAGASSHFYSDSQGESEVTSSASRRTNRCKNDDCAPRTFQNGIPDCNHEAFLASKDNNGLKSDNNSAPQYTTDNQGEDWICREINACLDEVSSDMASYRFAEAVETLYTTIWDKYADWFIESQKIYRNVPLLKRTLEALLIALHPFAPFVTEAIWQNLSWTTGFVITANWPESFKFDPISAAQFENITNIVSEVRSTLQALPGGNNAKKYPLMYDNDSLVEDNLLLIKSLTKVPAVTPLDGAPHGLRIALANHELYLDVPADVVKEFKDALTAKILSVGRELDALNARMMNPNYVDKAPAALVKETRDQIKDKESLISRLKTQAELI